MTITRAVTPFARMRGLLGRQGLGVGEALLLKPCNAIHTLFMRYPIDAVFLDRAGRVVRRIRGIRPWRFFVWGGWRACQVLEISPGPI